MTNPERLTHLLLEYADHQGVKGEARDILASAMRLGSWLDAQGVFVHTDADTLLDAAKRNASPCGTESLQPDVRRFCERYGE